GDPGPPRRIAKPGEARGAALPRRQGRAKLIRKQPEPRLDPQYVGGGKAGGPRPSRQQFPEFRCGRAWDENFEPGLAGEAEPPDDAVNIANPDRRKGEIAELRKRAHVR